MKQRQRAGDFFFLSVLGITIHHIQILNDYYFCIFVIIRLKHLSGAVWKDLIKMQTKKKSSSSAI